ncbi:MAG: hypothetical protein LCH92_22615 [Proteobacteria bacterium]|nr:hypothetical protein [Pseudomonadota bacterium]
MHAASPSLPSEVALGLVSAEDRLRLLFDPGSAGFEGSDALRLASGLVHGRPVLALADAGASDPAALRQRAAFYRRAADEGSALVEFLDCPPLTGAAGVEGLAAMDACLTARAALKGRGLSITALSGAALGPMALSAGLADLVAMHRGAGFWSLGGADLARRLGHEDDPQAAYGAADLHGAGTGLAAFAAADDVRLVLELRRLLSLTRPRAAALADSDEAFTTLLPADPFDGWDSVALIALVADEGESFALWPEYGTALACHLARIGGQPVGLLGSNPAQNGGALDAAACRKARRFVEFLTGQGLPLVMLLDTPGSLPGQAEEAAGALAEAAELRRALTGLRRPPVGLVLRRAQGIAALALGLGDARTRLIAWPGARISLGGGSDGPVAPRPTPQSQTKRALIAALSGQDPLQR